MSAARCCVLCGNPARTQVGWPRFRVRMSWICESCWIDWYAFCAVLNLLCPVA